MTSFLLKNEMSREVENFKKIIRGDFKEYCKQNSDETEENEKKEPKKVIADALYAGYLDTCRTIKWGEHQKKEIIDIFECKDSENDTSIIDDIVECISCNKKQDEFDKYHDNMCRKLINNFDSIIAYGQAQKIINMAFKYLYCIETIDRGCFKNCHMPLDSFTLEWIYRAYIKDQELKKDFGNLVNSVWKQGKKVKKEAIGSWSSMGFCKEDSGDKLSYLFYLKLLRQSFKDESLLELDFYVWPRIQKIMAAEAFIKVFKDDSNEQFDDLKEENEDYKIDKLECTLKRRTNIVKEIIKK